MNCNINKPGKTLKTALENSFSLIFHKIIEALCKKNA